MIKHTLTLNRDAVGLLAGALSQGAWYAEKDQTAHAYRAGQVLELPAMDNGPQPESKDPLVAKAWLSFPVSVELTDKQRDTVRACVEFFLKSGRLPPGRATSLLMRELGLAPED